MRCKHIFGKGSCFDAIAMNVFLYDIIFHVPVFFLLPGGLMLALLKFLLLVIRLQYKDVASAGERGCVTTTISGGDYDKRLYL